jgi:hypothetical protein
MICELGIGTEIAMSRQEALAKLKNYLESQPTPGAESARASDQQHQGESSTAKQTQSVDWSSFVKQLEEINSNTVETRTNVTAHFLRIEERLARIEQRQEEFVAVVKEGGDEGRTHYTPREFAEKLIKEGVKNFKGGVKGGVRRVRHWCSHKRIKAQRRPSGRGRDGEIMIPHSEYVRYKNEGLLPAPKD